MTKSLRQTRARARTRSHEDEAWERVIQDLTLLGFQELSIARLAGRLEVAMPVAAKEVEKACRLDLARARAAFKRTGHRKHGRGPCLCRHSVLLGIMTRNAMIRRKAPAHIAEAHYAMLQKDLRRRLGPQIERRAHTAPN